MKNLLMASSAIIGATALVASPAAAQELELSGFQHFFASGGDADADGSDRGFGFSTNTEIHVNGSIMADNGVTFGFRVEIEADANKENNVDENTIWASGGFGKIEFGNNDGAEDSFAVNGSNSGVDYGGVGNPTATFLTSAYIGGGARTSVDFRGGVDTSDATKITYTTPNFSGFSVGVSYTPDTACSDATGPAGGFCAENSTGFHDNIGAGIGYEGEFDGFGLEASVIGAWASADGEPEDDAYGIGGGLAVSFGGFTIASGIVWDDFSDGNDVGGTGETGKAWAADLGIGYAAGPWNFSINGIYSDEDDTDAELMAGSANIGYNLAPGVSVFVTGFVGAEEVDDEDNDIVAVTSGLKLAF